MHKSSYPALDQLVEDFRLLGSNPEQEAVFALFNDIEIRLKIEAPNFNGTITGDLGKAISELQSNLQRLWMLGISGSQNLTSNSAVRESIVLSLRVEKGSTDLKEVAQSIFERASQIPGIRQMKPVQWFILALVSIVIFGCYKGGELYLQSQTAQNLVAQLSQSVHDVQEKDLELLRLAFVKEQENKSVIARSVPQATSIQYGNQKLSKQDLDALRMRAARERAETFNIEGSFIIYQVCNLGQNNLKINVKDLDTGKEFPVRVENDLFSEPETYDRIWDYAKNRVRVNLQITESRKSSGSVYRLEAMDLE
ncbi:MAG: hypothetical protein KH037_12185 [Burkholderiales bacterium]|nr:hypothetical protein [Burkholderiales bacterium]